MPTTVNYFAFSLADPEHCAERFAGRPESARQRYVDDELVGPVGVGSILELSKSDAMTWT